MEILETDFLGINFKNPLVLASGILGISAEILNEVIENGAGGVTTKSIWTNPHVGHANPVVIANEHMLMNAVGLSDAGIEKAREEIKKFKEISSAPLIANVAGAKIADYVETVKQLSETEANLIEINISCPNVEDEFGRPFACDLNSAAAVCQAVRKVTDKKFTVKLTANVPNLGQIAKACEDAGADAITAINTIGPGMRINSELRSPILKNKVGGVSGPAILPIAIKAVHDVYKSVSVPIIGTGGITTGEEAIEMIIAGASLIGIGSGVHFRGIDVFAKVAQEMETWCQENNVKNIAELIGTLKY